VDRLKSALRVANGRIERAKRRKACLVAERRVARLQAAVRGTLNHSEELCRLVERLSAMEPPAS